MEIINNVIKDIDEQINSLPREDFLNCVVQHQKLSTIDVDNSENVYLKKSNLKNAGNGVFAKKNFNPGDIICFYPPYIIVDKESKKICSLDKEKKTYKEIMAEYGDYMLNLKQDIAVFGNPDFIRNKNYLGHMPNDRGYSPFKIYNDKFNNGFFSFLFLICSKPIKKDKEIYISYGTKYWYNIHPLLKTSRHLKIKTDIKKNK